MPRLCICLAAALAFALAAGCASHNSRHRNARAMDWESDEIHATHTTIPAAASASNTTPGNARAFANTTATPASPALSSHTNLYETWVPLNRWCSIEHLPAPARVSSNPTPIYSLRTTNGTMLFNAGSRIASWDGLEFRLGFAPEIKDSQMYVHALDVQKNVQPLMGAELPALTKTNPIIVVDPGHGGENAGAPATGGKHYEKEFTLDWALRLAPLLESNGWTVYLTRTNDTDLALSNRVNFAEAHKADLFLSLHFNSGGTDHNQNGLETYCLTPAGMTSTVTRGFSDDPGSTFPNNAYDAQNLVLAARVHRALLTLGMRDRGVRRARFPGVLRGQQRPAILIEGGYISNPTEAASVGQAAHRQKLAEAVATALSVSTPHPKLLSEAAAGQ